MSEKLYDAGRSRLLFLYKILYEKTDEQHALTFAEISEELEALGAPVGRKAFYDDIRALIYFGADIRFDKGRHSSYRLMSRGFEQAELKLLADAVNSSRFLTVRQSEALIGKLRSLTSVYKAGELRRQLFIADRERAGNKRIMANIDVLEKAIASKLQVRFRYFDYNTEKKKVYRGGADGLDRICSPYALAWDDEKYYLVAYNPNHDKLSNFRVDKMEHVRLSEEKCRPLPKGFSLAAYLDSQFSMFGGETQTVRLRFTNELVGAVLDRFGMQTSVIPDGEGHFRVNVPVKTSGTFFGWLFQFGSKAEILTPSVREQYREELLRAAEKNGQLR